MDLGEKTIPFIYFDDRSKKICEQLWLEELIGRNLVWYKNDENPVFEKGTSVLLYYQWFVNYMLIEKWISENPEYTYFLIHLSDEHCRSDVRIYNNPSIHKIFRNYWRPEVISDKVIHIPLGYNKCNRDICKPLLERKYDWSFAGAMDRPMRKEILNELEKINLVHKVHRTPTWDSSINLSEKDYLNLLLDTKIVPCMPGFFNVECFRFYEALECGAIPVISLDNKESYLNILAGPTTPLFIGCSGTDWSIVEILAKDKAMMKRAHDEIHSWWSDYKIYLKNKMRSIIFPYEKYYGFDSVHVINLEHRADRMELFKKNNPVFAEKYVRFDAIYGKNLKLDTEIYRLFRNNNYGWIKNVMGCALSHYRIIQQFATGDFGDKILIMEDDAVLSKDFIHMWPKMIPDIPDDSDIIFLGGVLPCNMKFLSGVTESVNNSFAKIKPNNFCGKNRRYFHFCTYCYILTKSGAKKLCDIIDNGSGIFHPIDHFFINCKDDLMNVYFSTPLLCGCTQDNDEVYIHASYDKIHEQTYDSDIRNNADSFTTEELNNYIP